MERKIGEIFECGGEWYQCVELPSDYIGCICNICSMNFDGKCPLPIRECQAENGRSDRKDVIFKKLEKLGEPFTDNGKLYQRYKVFDTDIANARSGVSMYVPVGNEKFVCIEIKQNKEDMEENKLNLKPFDLEAAIQGKPVCTRDGRKARIVCFDAKGCYPIIALTAELDNTEDITKCTEEGISSYHKNDDLMMLPEKHEGWVNVYKERCYETKEEAIKNKYDGATCVDTVKIEYYE